MIEVLATLAGIVFGAIGALIAVQQYLKEKRKEFREKLEAEQNKHADAKVKAYAAERDFNHLKRHLEQHNEAIKFLQDDLIEMKENQIEMRTLLKGIDKKVGSQE